MTFVGDWCYAWEIDNSDVRFAKFLKWFNSDQKSRPGL